MTPTTHTTEHVPASLGSCEVVDVDGARVRLGDLWSERPVVLVFLRHFG